MEHRDAVNQGGLRVIGNQGYQPLYETDERGEGRQGPDYAEDIEYRVSECRPLCVHIADHRGYVRGNGRAYVLAKHHCRSHIELYPSHIQHNQGDGHRGAGGLEYEREQGSQQEEKQHREEAASRPVAYEAQHLGALAQVRH